MMRDDSVSELDLQERNIGVEGGMLLAYLVPVMGGLTALDLSSNDLKDEGVSAVCEAIESNKETNLASLNMSENRIGPVGAKSVAAMVAVTGGLTSLDLSSNQLCGLDYIGRGDYTAEGITAIADAMRVNGALTSLDLSSNQLCGLDLYGHGAYTAEGITAIADALRVNGALTEVSLDGFALPVKKLKGTDPVETLDLSGKNLGVASAVVIASLISVNGALTSLDLSSNQLCGLDRYGNGAYTAEGITAIADALRANGALTSLNLSHNHLCGLDYLGRGTYTAEGITVIADAMRVNGALTKIDVSRNFLGPEGAKVLADALRVNGVLTALDLSSNDLKDEGVSAVCEAIQSNKETKLASLNMDANGIGPVGAKSVAAMVAVTGALTKLSLAWNKLEEEGTKAICEALKQNKTLKELDLS
eukprot:jgi/Chrpa1/24796/Chrysochromulina_OHIO_Genome00025720-RA